MSRGPFNELQLTLVKSKSSQRGTEWRSLRRMSKTPPISLARDDTTMRLVTFNVNGLRTLFHYQPFSDLNQSLEKVFDYFDSDIITLQELKTDRPSITKWGKVPGFYSFISIPQAKRGYSGVGCWVRILPDDHPMAEALKVTKAEEGITGLLSIKAGKSSTSYRDDPNIGIGGYESLGLDDEDESEGLKLDSEGRCVMIELACNIIVINVYCPANSGLSAEGSAFRMKYLKVLFKRIRNLSEMGKRVILMGDVNVCRDLIDHAEGLEQASIRIGDGVSGSKIESKHRDACEQFIINPDTPHRRMLNQMLADSILPEFAEGGILLDTTRLIQGRDRLKAYTVWNTLKNSRPVNYGSRIDFILASKSLKTNVTSADILPEVTGSDHCPVYADFDLRDLMSDIKPIDFKVPKFEARYKYGLMHKNVLEMFGKGGNGQTAAASHKRNKVDKKVPTRRPKAIDNFFESTRKPKVNFIVDQHSTASDMPVETVKTLIMPGAETPVKSMFGEAPLCKHGLKAIQRTSRTPSNPGRKFWICKLPKGSSDDESSSCGFFQWA